MTRGMVGSSCLFFSHNTGSWHFRGEPCQGGWGQCLDREQLHGQELALGFLPGFLSTCWSLGGILQASRNGLTGICHKLSGSSLPKANSG